jgi:inosine-uridine nucleoside N-ribohydrolase
MKIDRRMLMGGALAGSALLIANASGAAEPGVSDTPLPRLLDNHRVIVDTDPGNDDAIAIMMALSAPNLKVEAITVCPGNVDYDKELRNALYTVEVCGYAGKVPVHAGMRRPILDITYPAATFIHGKYGLGNVEVPQVAQKIDPEHAALAIIRIARTHPGEVVILALGGLSNVAMALLLDPAIAKLIKGVQFVAGANSALPGFNVLADPEAAHVVFNSGVPLVIGLGGPEDTILTKADFDHIATFNTPRSRFFMASNELRLTFEMSARNASGSVNADPMAVAMIIDPSIGERFKAVAAKVELEGEYTRGVVLYGENRYSMKATAPANANLCVKASNEKFKKLLFDTLRKT